MLVPIWMLSLAPAHVPAAHCTMPPALAVPVSVALLAEVRLVIGHVHSGLGIGAGDGARWALMLGAGC